MTKPERAAMWGLVAGLVVFAFGASLRINTLQTGVSHLAVSHLASTTTSTSSTPMTGGTTPLAAAVEQLRREVTELRATRGLSGPEVRMLVETLLPAPGCVEPPCESTTPDLSGSGATASTTTTVKR